AVAAAAPSATAAAAALLARTRLVDRQGAAAVGRPVQRVDGGLRLVVVRHLDEPEAPAPPAELVDDDLAARDRPVSLEQLHEIIAGGVVWQVADVDVLAHG